MNHLSRRLCLAFAEDALRQGNPITIRPTGSSMQPRIQPGDEVTLEPSRQVSAGDVVLARVQRRRSILVLHQVLAIEDGKYLIGNASGREDGWVESSAVVGKSTRVERAASERA